MSIKHNILKTNKQIKQNTYPEYKREYFIVSISLVFRSIRNNTPIEQFYNGFYWENCLPRTNFLLIIERIVWNSNFKVTCIKNYKNYNK